MNVFKLLICSVYQGWNFSYDFAITSSLLCFSCFFLLSCTANASSEMPNRWTVSHKLCGCKWERLQIWAVSIWCVMNQKQFKHILWECICQIVFYFFPDIWPLKPHPLRSLCSRWKPTQAWYLEPLPSVYLRYTFVSSLNKAVLTSHDTQYTLNTVCLVCRCTRCTVVVSMLIS